LVLPPFSMPPFSLPSLGLSLQLKVVK